MVAGVVDGQQGWHPAAPPKPEAPARGAYPVCRGPGAAGCDAGWRCAGPCTLQTRPPAFNPPSLPAGYQALTLAGADALGAGACGVPHPFANCSSLAQRGVALEVEDTCLVTAYVLGDASCSNRLKLKTMHGWVPGVAGAVVPGAGLAGRGRAAG